MGWEFNIARRLSDRRGGARAGIMERVATVATALSLAVIIITLSVVVGFKAELARMLSGSTSDIVVTAPQSGGVVSSVGLPRGEALEHLFDDKRIKRAVPYTAKEGVLKDEQNIVGVLLKGVDTLYDLSFFEEHLRRGSMPRIGTEPRTKDILLSQSIAQRMAIDVGDRVEMVFITDNRSVLRDRFTVGGVYQTGVENIDNHYIITDMRNVARLYDGNSDIVTGYELWLNEGTDAAQMAKSLNEQFITLYLKEGIDAEAFTLMQIYPQVFGWLATHDVNAMLIVAIMVIVALLNMATALLIIVLERQRLIGELRAMGATQRSVVGIFVWRSLFILGRGVVWGVAIGISLCLVQHLWQPLPLPTEGYMLSHVPVAMCWGLWAATVGLVIAVSMLFMTLPSLFASRISPAETMKYND